MAVGVVTFEHVVVLLVGLNLLYEQFEAAAVALEEHDRD